MIKIKDLENILASAYNKEVLTQSAEIFKKALNSQTPTNNFIADFCQMSLSNDVWQVYYNEGLSVLYPMLNAKKKLDISMVGQEYIIYTGLLNKEFVIGYDTVKEMVTSIFTKSENLLNLLNKYGAFDNTEKFNKNMKALFGEGKQEYGNKLVTSFEKQSLAMGRIDIVGVIGDEVSLDLIIPSKFRTDYGDTFKLYPYAVFPYLSNSLIHFVNSLKEKTFSEKNKKVVDVRALTVLQVETDGNVKTRRLTFAGEEVVKAYRRGTYASMDEADEAKEMLKNQIRKTECKWDCLKLYLKAFNLEASLYSTPYTTIRFERLMNILPCSLKDVDTSQYMVDFDSVRRLFRARVNNWTLKDFTEFNKILNTDDCANISDRIHAIDAWSYGLDDSDLFKIMKMKRSLFEPEINGKVKTIEAGLDDMYRQKPNAAKHLSYIDLETDFLKRKNQVIDLLKTGVCKIESLSSRTGAPRTYYATNCPAVLKASYGENRLNAFESPKRAILGVKSLVESGKVASYNAFISRLQKAEVDALVDYGSLDESSTESDWVNVLDSAYQELENKDDRSKLDDDSAVSYVVNFRRINADSRDEFYGAVDVRNIVSLEYGKQNIRKD